MATEDIDARTLQPVAMVVCRGRTVVTGLAEKMIDQNGVKTKVPNPDKYEFFEGEEVNLPPADAERLRAMGFVHHPHELPPGSRPANWHSGLSNSPGLQTPDGPTAMDDGAGPAGWA